LFRQPVHLSTVDVKECSRQFYLDHRENVSIVDSPGCNKVELHIFTTHSGQTHPLQLTSGVPQGSNQDYDMMSSRIYLIHRMYNQYLFLTLCSIPHVCRWHTQSYSHCAISEIPAL